HRPRAHPDQGLGGVHGRRVRDEETIDATFAGELPVALQVARVLRQVFCGAELEGVHEDAHDHAVGALLRPIDEPQVPFVQESHRRHEPDATPAGALGARPGAHLLQARELVLVGLKTTKDPLAWVWCYVSIRLPTTTGT